MSEYRIDPFSGDVDFSPASIWAHAKQDYLMGESAQRVCDRYEIALSTFRTRAREEGWRRSDVTEEPAEAEAPPRELPAAPPTAELIEQAWRAAADAIRRGRVYEARAWMKLVKELREEKQRENNNAAWQAVNAARAAAKTEAAAETEGNTDTLDPALHPLHSKSDGAATESGPAPPAPCEAEVSLAIRKLQGLSGTSAALPGLLSSLKALQANARAVDTSRRERDDAERKARAARAEALEVSAECGADPGDLPQP